MPHLAVSRLLLITQDLRRRTAVQKNFPFFNNYQCMTINVFKN